jgi:hypothetical protein
MKMLMLIYSGTSPRRISSLLEHASLHVAVLPTEIFC